MTPDQFEILIQLLHQHTILLERIAIATEQNTSAPNYTVSLEKYHQFDWASIGAVIEQTDIDGVAAVIWQNKRYTRRSATNKFQPAIWFSRAIGKNDQGETQYERLITFKAMPQPEPLPAKVKQHN